MDLLSALLLSRWFNFICLLKNGAVSIAAHRSISPADRQSPQRWTGTDQSILSPPALGSLEVSIWHTCLQWAPAVGSCEAVICSAAEIW